MCVVLENASTSQMAPARFCNRTHWKEMNVLRLVHRAYLQRAPVHEYIFAKQLSLKLTDVLGGLDDRANAFLCILYYFLIYNHYAHIIVKKLF